MVFHVQFKMAAMESTWCPVLSKFSIYACEHCRLLQIVCTKYYWYWPI